MREPNLSFPSQNRAVVCITSALYDRRALDCTATLPLVNSLTHLVYLTSTTPRIREILCLDGGLERLVRILQQTPNKVDRLTLWKWTLAFQNIVNIGVRGTEQIRTKVVDAGVIPFVLTILGNHAKSYELQKDSKKDSIATASSSSSKGLLDNIPSISSYTNQNNASSSSNTALPRSQSSKLLRRSTYPYLKIDPVQRRFKRIHRKKQDSKLSEIDNNVFHREEDVLLCLQLLAYLSKYPHIRDLFHTAYEKNVFSVVEKFCNRIHPAPIQYWASVIMRNACRKDETQGGIRRCANMSCGKWESQPREFAKCRRCRKAKYCSKSCQSKAWADGHRWWCVERQSSTTAPHNHASASAATASNTIIPATTNIDFTPLNNNSPRPTTNFTNEQSSSDNDRMTINTDNGESSDNQNVIFNVAVNF